MSRILPKANFKCETEPQALVVLDGDHIAAGNYYLIYIWNIRTGQLLAKIDLPWFDATNLYLLRYDRKQLVALNSRTLSGVIDWTKGELTKRIESKRYQLARSNVCRLVGFSTDFIVAFGAVDNTVGKYFLRLENLSVDAEMDPFVCQFEWTGKITCVVHLEGSIIAVGSKKGATLFDVQSGNKIHKFCSVPVASIVETNRDEIIFTEERSFTICNWRSKERYVNIAGPCSSVVDQIEKFDERRIIGRSKGTLWIYDLGINEQTILQSNQAHNVAVMYDKTIIGTSPTLIQLFQVITAIKHGPKMVYLAQNRLLTDIVILLHRK
jgi:hypothetical protein